MISMYENEDGLYPILTVEEAREYLNIGRNTILKLLHHGALKGFKVGRQWRIRREDLIEFTKTMNTDIS